jgi:unsaturated rhamnogalacturonyl hydrolase
LKSASSTGHDPGMLPSQKVMGFTGAFLLLLATPPANFAQSGAITSDASTALEPAAILKTMERAADWQLTNASPQRPTAWIMGAFYTGLMALGGISGDPAYLGATVRMAEDSQWKPGPRLYDADDHCIGQTYAELYLRHGEDYMIAPLRATFDNILEHPSDVASLEFKKPDARARQHWSWCDSLFMGPPAWMRLYAATRDTRYLDFAVSNWWQTSDYLYDKTEHLYFRDSTFFDKREANGKKVFWGRGNGWVMAGLVRVLQFLPDNHPSRDRFVAQFREMAGRVLALQQSDGLWRSSLLDPQSYPLKETSGSGFFTYALAWGVNQGLLDRAVFEPAVERGWRAIAGCVQADGKLIHVQPVGSDPRNFDENSCEPYGVGALLLAGTEIYRMAAIKAGPCVRVIVHNPAQFARLSETVELEWNGLAERLKISDASKMVVMDGALSRILDSQPYASNPGLAPDKLLFQADLAPGENRSYIVLASAALPAEPHALARTYARLVTERMNDMAWESDRIAHRMYQLALIKGEGTVSSGIDVWSKRTRSLVVDKWYKGGDYHVDHGEGMDDYRVGRSRGCGGLGIWDGHQLYVSLNFNAGRILTTGPIRSEFELTYDGWDAAGRKVSEVKRISIDAGSNFSRAQSVFTCDGGSPLGIGIGIAQRPVPGVLEEDQQAGWLAYWQPPDGEKGNIGCAVIVPGGIEEFAMEKASLPVMTQADLDKPSNEGAPPVANLLAITKAIPGKPLVYYFGAGWSKSGDFPDARAWQSCVSNFATRLREPLKVEFASP